ncbi:MAG: XRE family transcriptional regulator [Nitrospirae bacterium]|nr:MAG: XRE family transcriptional regulator [Nitrospirota bacterium]
MARLKSFDKMRKKWLEDSQVKKEYDSMGQEFQIAMEIAQARLHAGVTQAELARKVGTKSTAISRLESPHYGKASLSMLRKIAGALDCELQVRLVPKH